VLTQAAGHINHEETCRANGDRARVLRLPSARPRGVADLDASS
jgi:hypothetical protein